MLRKIIGLTLLIIALNTTLQAQLQRVMHQTFETAGTDGVQLQLVGDITVESWAGNLIMTETTVQLQNASPSIFDHFIEMGRYEVLEMRAKEDSTLKLVSKDPVRPKVKSSRGEFRETVQVRVFMPEFFESASDSLWTRRIEPTDSLATPANPADTLAPNASGRRENE